MQKSNEILISLLTYNSAEVIEDCLKSLENQTNKNFKCFVFDNNSTDNIEEIVKKYSWIKFIKTGSNYGYTGGHNFAFKYFKKNLPRFKYMMVLNPDTVLKENLMEEFFKLFKHKVTLYTCMMKKSPTDRKMWTSKNIHLPSFTFTGRYLKNNEYRLGRIKTSFVLGSCFVIDLEKYKEKYLFKDYFMYHDEIELSLRLRLQGETILATTKSYVTHITKKIKDLNNQTVYLLELNRLKLQSDLFSDLYVFLNLPFYLVSRILIFVLF